MQAPKSIWTACLLKACFELEKGDASGRHLQFPGEGHRLSFFYGDGRGLSRLVVSHFIVSADSPKSRRPRKPDTLELYPECLFLMSGVYDGEGQGSFSFFPGGGDIEGFWSASDFNRDVAEVAAIKLKDKARRVKSGGGRGRRGRLSSYSR